MRPPFLPVIVLSLCLTAAPVAAQQYFFHSYDETSGLPSSTVLSISQDTEGLLWFGTARGLARYDGVKWESVGPASNQATMRHLFVGQDHQGRMWTVGEDPRLGVHRHDEGQWQAVPMPTGPLPDAIPAGICLGQTTTGGVLLAIAGLGGRLIVHADGRWRRFDVGTAGVRLKGVVADGEALVVATNQGLFRLDTADWNLAATELAGRIHAVCAAGSDDGLWVIGEGWIGLRTDAGLQVLARDLPLVLDIDALGASAIADGSGGIYFGDLGRLYFFHPVFGLQALSRANGLATEGVTNFFADREGHVWISTMRGVSKLVNIKFAGYDRQQGLFDDEVSAVIRRRDGSMVLGHFGGLTFADSVPRIRAIGRGNPMRERVMDFAESPSGELWFAADELGVLRLDPDGDFTLFSEPEGVVGNAFALLFDPGGRMWAGTSQGLIRWDGRRFVPVGIGDALSGGAPLIRRLLVASDGALYAGSNRDGVYRLQGEEVYDYPPAAEAVGDMVYTLYEAPGGEIYVGTTGGLFEARADSVVRVVAPGPEIRRPIYAMLADARGRMWFGTDNGIMRWDGATLVHVTNRDGLLGTEVNRDALQLGPRDEVWIGTDRGLTIYREEFDLPALAPPLVKVTGYEVDGEMHAGDRPLRLSRPARALDIFFRGVTFGDESRTTYQTWLQGFEDAWQEPSRRPDRLVRYTNVPPGRYRFHVKVVRPDGAESPVAVGDEILIKPTLSARLWFRAAVAFVVLAVLWLAAQIVLGRRYAGRLRRTVGERTAELEQSEAAVRAESQRLAVTLASISDGVITLDREALILMLNPAAERFLARAADELVGRPLMSVLAVEPPLILAHGEPTTHAYTHQDGHLSWVEISVARIARSDEGDSGTVLAFRDITARREIDDERIRAHQLESLGVLAGGIAHDFNNLLAVILGNLSLLEDATTIGTEEREQLERMEEATEQARALTAQFLTFARGGAPSLAPADLGEIARGAAALAFSGAPVTWQLNLMPDLPNALVDRRQIGQVLQNLFLNASQAMPGGGEVIIDISAVPDSPPGVDGWVQLSVADSGPGIAEQDLARIFEPYFTTKSTGTGLGLAVAHSIVQRHGGKLNVATVAGRGTVFTVCLPATEAAAPAARNEPAVTALEYARILVMDDDQAVATTCCRMLAALGLAHSWAANGTEAIRQYDEAKNNSNGFDAVIMDLTVPGGMGGREAIAILLERDSAARVIVASGYSKDPIMANHAQHGFKGALRKPYTLATLRRVLGAVLAGEDGAE